MKKRLNEMTHDEFIDWFFVTARDIYIEHLGKSKWDSFTKRQQIDVVMTIARDFSLCLDRMEA